MFTLLFRKMRNTKWMVLCLLIGFVMASAMMSTIPIYMNASLQRMLVKDLESFQTEYEIYPGAYNTSYGLKMDISGSEQQKAVENYNNKVEAKFKELGLPEKLDKKYISDEYLYVRSLAVSDGNSQARFTLRPYQHKAGQNVHCRQAFRRRLRVRCHRKSHEKHRACYKHSI